MLVSSVNMGGATILAIVVIAVIVLALAAYLLAICAVLGRVSSNLDKLISGAWTISDQTTPAPEVVGGIAGNVMGIREALAGLLTLAASAPARVPSASVASSAAPRAPAPLAPTRLTAEGKPVFRTTGRAGAGTGRGRRVGSIHRED
ncbi:MAG: hypothetical protein ACRDYC_05470 [Acidimicrobiales bacterium]